MHWEFFFLLFLAIGAITLLVLEKVLCPGGYRFKDFLKVGLPLDLLLCAVGITITPWFWPI